CLRQHSLATGTWIASESLRTEDPSGRFAKKNPATRVAGSWVKTLAMTYSRMLDAHYHRRVRVSLPSSEWNRVVPRSYCHQGEGGGSRLGPGGVIHRTGV